MTVSARAWMKDHYEFTLPDHYVGWIQIIFNDRMAQFQYNHDKAHRLIIGENGVYRTASIRVLDLKPSDTFFYRIPLPDGSTRLEPIPKNFVLHGLDDGGFEVAGTGDQGGEGSSWFIFVGPPELRSKVPLADWDIETKRRIAVFGTPNTGPPNPLPHPGRMTLPSSVNPSPSGASL